MGDKSSIGRTPPARAVPTVLPPLPPSHGHLEVGPELQMGKPRLSQGQALSRASKPLLLPLTMLPFSFPEYFFH